jgi:hypothetical protein
MNIEDIERHIIVYNIDKKSNKRYYIDNRTYIYAILYHIHGWNLSKIAKRFSKHHTTVKFTLEKAEYIQNYDSFIENTKLLQEQYFFIIPAYSTRMYSKSKSKDKKEYTIHVKLNKDEYIEYLKKKDVADIYSMLWNLTITQAKAHNKPNPLRKKRNQKS